ncbi:MAG: purine-nucleoside phosphorylase [Desulfovibrio sp.]|uniref:purine-nucleoside phosphorylase n=1 Tax=Desulfovibrio sp. 7SRBS1 TaxID=3378064 RepID=UPI003B3F2C13
MITSRTKILFFLVWFIISTCSLAPAQESVSQESTTPQGQTKENTAASQTTKVIAPKVLVLAMFEVGKFTGDAPGEAQLWVEQEKLDTQINVEGIPHPLYFNPTTGLAITVTDMGTVNAAATVMALGLSPKIDLSKTFVLIAGIAGGPPAFVSTGSAFWANYVVDADLAYEISNYEFPTTDKPLFHLGCPGDFCDNGWTAGYEIFELNKKLSKAAFETSRNVELADTQAAESYRRNYPQTAARLRPFVAQGDVLSSGTYFHGKVFGRWADWWMKKWTKGEGEYRVTAMEDSGTLLSLSRLNKIKRADFNRAMVLRTISNYDRQHPGQTALESLQADSGGYIISIKNAYRVGSAVAHDIIANPEKWEALVQ